MNVDNHVSYTYYSPNTGSYKIPESPTITFTPVDKVPESIGSNKNISKLGKVKTKLKPLTNFVVKNTIGLVKRVVPGAIIMTTAFMINNGVRTSQQEHYQQQHTQTQTQAPQKSASVMQVYEAGKQHCLDSIKIAEYEKQIQSMQQKISADSIKILELTGKAAKHIK